MSEKQRRVRSVEEKNDILHVHRYFQREKEIFNEAIKNGKSLSLYLSLYWRKRYYERAVDMSRQFLLKININLTTGSLKSDQLPVNHNRVQERTAQALCIGSTTLKRVLAEEKETGSPQPPKMANCGRKKFKIDCFGEGVIRRAVMEMYARREFPTLDKIHAQLQDDENFPKLSKSTLWSCMKKQLKFKFGRFENKPVIFERDDVTAQRQKYLLFIKKYRRQGYQVI
jgi:hypothetical protein